MININIVDDNKSYVEHSESCECNECCDIGNYLYHLFDFYNDKHYDLLLTEEQATVFQWMKDEFDLDFDFYKIDDNISTIEPIKEGTC